MNRLAPTLQNNFGDLTMKKNNTYKIINSDCLYALSQMASNSIDSIVTDSPYGISFQNANWDKDIASIDIWKEAYRVLKPGGFVLCFASARTQHRVATRLEDCQFIIKDTIYWIYGTGYCRTEKYEVNIQHELEKKNINDNRLVEEFRGVGSKLKPACEPIIMAQKPISECSYTLNIMKYKTGGINLGKCSFNNGDMIRQPANVIHDGSPAVVEHFPVIANKSAARYFYIAKPSRAERNFGLMGLPKKSKKYTGSFAEKFNTKPQENFHSTVKPVKLMSHLVNLVTPKNGTCLDIFNGSGTTGVSCVNESISYVGVELDSEYCLISQNRINAELNQKFPSRKIECTYINLSPDDKKKAA